jgi:tRNA (Thr-GGU) A37 N-methylase
VRLCVDQRAHIHVRPAWRGCGDGLDGTIVVALLTVLAAKRAATKTGYPWMLGRAVLAGVGRLQHRPRPVCCRVRPCSGLGPLGGRLRA